MCQPPEVTLQGQAEVFEQATSNEGWNSSDGWASPTLRNQASATWPEDGLPAAQDPQSLNNLTAQFMKYNQQQQQQLQMQQRTAQMGWGQNLTEKLQMAAANASHKQQMNSAAQAQLNWMARAQNMQQQPQSFPSAGVAAPSAMWPAIAPQPMMGGLTPQLMAQGIPLGMAQLGQMEMAQMYGQIEVEDDDDDKDPKKFKRMMSNRASAKRSRQRRQERLDELEIVSAKLQVENSAVQRKLHEAQDRIKKFQIENESLQEELRSLKEMLAAKAATNTNTMTTTTTSGSRPGNASPGTMTKQDSCGANGSTTDNPSSGPSSTPSPQVNLGKRRHEQMNQAESRFQEQGEVQRLKTQVSPVTPSSGITSNSQEVAAVKEPVVPGVLGILDDDLFTTFMDDCFEAKPLDAVLARQ